MKNQRVVDFFNLRDYLQGRIESNHHLAEMHALDSIKNTDPEASARLKEKALRAVECEKEGRAILEHVSRMEEMVTIPESDDS